MVINVLLWTVYAFGILFGAFLYASLKTGRTGLHEIQAAIIYIGIAVSGIATLHSSMVFSLVVLLNVPTIFIIAKLLWPGIVTNIDRMFNNTLAFTIDLFIEVYSSYELFKWIIVLLLLTTCMFIMKAFRLWSLSETRAAAGANKTKKWDKTNKDQSCRATVYAYFARKFGLCCNGPEAREMYPEWKRNNPQFYGKTGRAALLAADLSMDAWEELNNRYSAGNDDRSDSDISIVQSPASVLADLQHQEKQTKSSIRRLDASIQKYDDSSDVIINDAIEKWTSVQREESAILAEMSALASRKAELDEKLKHLKVEKDGLLDKYKQLKVNNEKKEKAVKKKEETEGKLKEIQAQLAHQQSDAN